MGILAQFGTRFGTRASLATAIALCAVAPLMAAPAEQIRARTNAYKTLGAAFKTVNDATRSGQLRTSQVQQAAAQIGQIAQRQYALYPTGSGPRAGVRTDAKPEIWSRPRDFRAAQDAFARQAASLQRAVAGGEASTVRLEARKLGGTCKACHDAFRAERD